MGLSQTKVTSATAVDSRSGMPYTIVRGDPRLHKSAVLDMLGRNLPGPFEARWTKYYERNPLGPPLFVLAQEVDTQDFVGIAALFPTQVRVDGESVDAAIGGDFAIDARHRGLGPAFALQRALLSALPERQLSFAYGPPNDLSGAVLRHVGWVDLGRWQVFVKVLKTRWIVERYVPHAATATLLARVASILVDPILPAFSGDVWHRRRRKSDDFRVEKPASFDDLFSRIFSEAADRYRIMGERSPEFLNWKYEYYAPIDMRRYSIFALVSSGTVFAFIVYAIRDGVRHVYDILWIEGRSVLHELLRAFIKDARRQGDSGIVLPYIGPTNSLTRAMRKFGFLRRRSRKGVVIYVPPDARSRDELLSAENWYFFWGDNDI